MARASTKNKTKLCLKCNDNLALEEFYMSNSPLHGDKKVPYCKSCLLEMVDINNIATVIEVLRAIDKPFIAKMWENALEKNKNNPFGVYMRGLTLPQNKGLCWKDGEAENIKHVTQIASEINKKSKQLEEVTQATKETVKEIVEVPPESIEKWGIGYTPEEYIMFEKKYKLLEGSYPIRSTMHLEALITYVRYRVKEEIATSKNDIASAKQWGALAKDQATSAKINPSQLTASDLSQGLDTFSQLVQEVEKAVDIIPILPQFLAKPKDKVDFTVLCYVNYERHLRGLPLVEYEDVYDFYNKMVEDYIQSNPTDYAFLTDDRVKGDTLVERVYNYIFDIVIPQKKEEFPNVAFYQNLDKWVELVSFYRFYPDLWVDLITPKTGGIRLDLDQRVLMRSMSRFKKIYTVLPRGYGKCVAYDTMIFTDKGIREIGSLFNNKKQYEEEIIDHKVSMLNRFGQLEESNKGIISGYKDTRKIKTLEGYEIETSMNHPLLIIDSDGNLKYKRAEELKIGDILAINRKNDIWGNELEISIDMEGYLNSQTNSAKWQIEKCKTPTTLTEEMALIMGYLIGDGTLTRKNLILFTNKDKDIIDRYKKFMEEQIGVSVSVRKSKIDYCSYGVYHREYFRQIGLEFKNAFEKEIPSCILNAPKNIVSAFIRGLFDTDGGIDKTFLSFTTASEKMSKQIQTVLLNFGIISRREKKFNKTYETYSYRILIYGENVDLFLKEIGFSCKRKQDKLIEICQVKRNTNKNIIPYQKNRVISLFEKNKSDNNSKFGDESYHVRKGNNELTYSKLNKILSKYNINKDHDPYLELNSLLDLNYFYSKVDTIEESSNYVCDIQMPETHSFIGNGFVNHNTFIQSLSGFHTAVFFPNIDICMTAQTKENASALIKDKFAELMKFYPMLKEETIEKKNRFADNLSEVYWKSGGKIDSLANAQSSKGQRRKRMVVEESALLNNKLFEDALEPIVNVPRRTIGVKAIISPIELNGQITFFTTSGYRGSSEYERNLKMADDMTELKGIMIYGSDFELASSMGRGEPKAVILGKKETLSPSAFAMNYMSHWVGSTDGALININKVMDLRTVTKAQFKTDGKCEYIIGVDVARSQNKSNNQSSIVIIQLIKNKKGKLVNAKVVNIINMPSTVNFTTLAIEIMRIKEIYDAKMIVVDSNGLGVGLVDELLKEQFDPKTNESLGCYDTVNTDQEPEIDNAEECVYALKSQAINTQVIVNFIDYIESGKLQLLEKRNDVGYDVNDDDYIKREVLPFAQTDLLIDEIANLQLENLGNSGLKVKQVTKRVDKDRYSALAYALWYIKNYEENNGYFDTGHSATDYLFIN